MIAAQAGTDTVCRYFTAIQRCGMQCLDSLRIADPELAMPTLARVIAEAETLTPPAACEPVHRQSTAPVRRSPTASWRCCQSQSLVPLLN